MTTNPADDQQGETLLPCPFCGEPAKFEDGGFNAIRVACSDFDCEQRRRVHKRDRNCHNKLAAHWNTRAAVAGPRSVVNLEAWTTIDSWLREHPNATAAECLAELVRRIEVETAAPSSPAPAESVVVAGRVVNISTHGEPTRARLREIETSVSNGYEREYRKSGWSKALQFAIRDLHFLLTFFRDDVTSDAPAGTTRVAEQTRIPSDFITATGELKDWNTITEAQNRDKAQEIILATEAALGERFDSIARHELVNRITVALYAAAPADNDAESDCTCDDLTEVQRAQGDHYDDCPHTTKGDR